MYSAHCRFDEEHFPCRERSWPAVSVGQIEGEEIFQRVSPIDQDRLTNFPARIPTGSVIQGISLTVMVLEAVLVRALCGVPGLTLGEA